jgi:hypothetical protein
MPFDAPLTASLGLQDGQLVEERLVREPRFGRFERQVGDGVGHGAQIQAAHALA